uniref:Nucleolar complex protein 2 homolog n=1 Tax=Arcella intermedia TaxID=1963864 RepID=A0A6B2KZ78_9EUKA
MKSANQDNVKPDNAQQPKIDEVAEHAKELKALQTSQAEFFQFLEKEDADLLKFGLEDDQKLEEDEAEPEKESGAMQLDQERFDKWMKEAPTSIKATRLIVKAFHVAAFTSCDQESDENFTFNYRILNSAVFNDIMMYSLKEIPAIFDSLLNRERKEGEQSEKSQQQIPNKYPQRWSKIKNMVRVYIKSLLKFLNSLAEHKMINFVLKCTERLVPYFGPFPRYSKVFLKKLLTLWGSSDEAVRIMAFFNIRAMALNLPYPFINMILKGAYLDYFRSAKFSNPRTIPMITFMMNCVVELYGIDLVSSYQHAFVYLRQIAIHIRTAHGTKSRTGHDSTYNWQFLHSIKVWVKLLCTYPNEEDLWLLAYPLIQVIHGFISLIPTARYYPLRFHGVRMLNELVMARSRSRANVDLKVQGTFINSVPYLLEVLTFPSLFKKTKPWSGKVLDITHLLKVNDKYLATQAYADTLLKEVHEHLVTFFAAYARSISFPELIVPIVVQIKQFLKDYKPTPYATKLKNLIDVLQNNAKLILSHRNLTFYSPAEMEKVATFMADFKNRTPLETYYDNLQKVLAQEREILARTAEKEWDEENKLNKGEGESDEEGDDEGDDEDDEGEEMEDDGPEGDDEGDEEDEGEAAMNQVEEEDGEEEQKEDVVKSFNLKKF